MGDKYRNWILVGALLTLGLAIRLAIAWELQWTAVSDAGICALMAKHMAEGLDWPVFFYGQPYMGNVEPFFSMLVSRVLGWSVFNTSVGTVLVGLTVLPGVYFWGRRLGGLRAGLIAMALCLLGPLGYAHYMASPRGGYALQIAFTPAILVWTIWLAEREWLRRPPSWWHYAGVGILAGLAWWTSQLVFSTLVTAGLIFLPALWLRQRAWCRALIVLASFALGCLPWLFWNATHGWATLEFAGSMGQVRWTEGMALQLTRRLPDLMDLALSPRWLGMAALAVFAGAWCWALIRSVGVLVWKPRDTAQAFWLAPLWLYPLLHLAISARSHFVLFDTSRYVLPLFPVLAVAVAVGLAALTRWRVGRGITIAVVALLLAAQCRILVIVRDIARNTRTGYETVANVIVPALRTAGVEALYADYVSAHWMNAAGGEHCIWVDPIAERYLPYALRAETTARLGLWNVGGDASAFVRASGGAARTVTAGGASFCCDLRSPCHDVAEIAPADWSWAGFTGVTGNLSRLLTDRSLASVCPESVETNAPYLLTVELSATQAVCGVRWVSADGEYPPWWRVETWADDGTWRALTGAIPCNGFFWNGPRLYWGWQGYQARVWFPATTTRRLRLVFGRDDNPLRPMARVAELALFTPAPSSEDEIHALPDLLARVQAHGLRRLYCGRWLANAVAEATAGGVWTPRETGIWDRRSVQDLPGDRSLKRQPILLDAAVGWVVGREDEPAMRAMFAARGVELTGETVGPWTLLRPTAGLTDAGRFLIESDFVWCGEMTLADPQGTDMAARIKLLPSVVDTAHGTSTRMETWLSDALTYFPDHPGFVDALAKIYRARGETARAEKCIARFRELTVPSCPVAVSFGGGLALTGVTGPDRSYKPGEVVRLRFFWKMHGIGEPRPTLFVHARLADKTLFQSDVALQEGRSGSQMAFQAGVPLTLTQEIVLRIPPTAPLGRYILHMGVVKGVDARRCKPTTALPVRQRAVQLPLVVDVVSDGNH